MVERARDAPTRGFSAASTRATLDVACRRAGLDAAGATLLRLGENALYRLASGPIVVRIARTMDYWDDVSKEVAVARWLQEHRFPAVTLAGPATQPVEALGHPVSFWRYIDGRLASREVEILGRLLRRFHALPAPSSFRLPELDTLARVRQRARPRGYPETTSGFCSTASTSCAGRFPHSLGR